MIICMQNETFITYHFLKLYEESKGRRKKKFLKKNSKRLHQFAKSEIHLCTYAANCTQKTIKLRKGSWFFSNTVPMSLRKEKFVCKWSKPVINLREKRCFASRKMMIKVSTFLRVLFIPFFPFLWKKGGGSFLHSNVAAFHIEMATFRLTTTDGWEGKDSSFCTSNICHIKSSQNGCLKIAQNSSFLTQKPIFLHSWVGEAIAHWQKSEKSCLFFRWQM